MAISSTAIERWTPTTICVLAALITLGVVFGVRPWEVSKEATDKASRDTESAMAETRQAIALTNSKLIELQTRAEEYVKKADIARLEGKIDMLNGSLAAKDAATTKAILDLERKYDSLDTAIKGILAALAEMRRNP